MSLERFNVILVGTAIRGVAVSTAAAELAKLIKRDTTFAATLLSGQATNIKSSVDAVTGARYIAALQRIGVVARLEPETLDVDAEIVPHPIGNREIGGAPSVGTMMQDEAPDAVVGAPTEKVENPRLARLMVWPNLLCVVLIAIAAMLSATKETSLIDAMGRAIAMSAVPLVIGLVWLSLRRDWRILKWLYVASTILFFFIFVSVPLQKRYKPESTVAPKSAEVPDRISEQPTTPPNLSQDPLIVVDPDDFAPQLVGTWNCTILATGGRIEFTFFSNGKVFLVGFDGVPRSSPDGWRIENSVLLSLDYPDREYSQWHINLLTGTSLLFIDKNGGKVECLRSR